MNTAACTYGMDQFVETVVVKNIVMKLGTYLMNISTVSIESTREIRIIQSQCKQKKKRKLIHDY